MKVGSLEVKSPTAIARLVAVAATLIEEGVIKVDADFNLVSDALNAGYQQRVFDSWAVLGSLGDLSGEGDMQAPMMVEGWTWGDLHAVTRDVVEAEGYRATTAGLNKLTDAVYVKVAIDKEEGRIPDIETVTWYVRDCLRDNISAGDGVYSVKGE
jgi:hypothetical protein